MQALIDASNKQERVRSAETRLMEAERRAEREAASNQSDPWQKHLEKENNRHKILSLELEAENARR